MKIIWYEDQETDIQYFKEHIDPKLSKELAFFGWTHEYIERDWDLISEKYAKAFKEGTRQIWIIDLRSTEMTKRRRPEIQVWLEKWITKSEDQLIIKNFLKQDGYEINELDDYSGVILAIIARKYNIPFFYATGNPGTLKNICTYLASDEKPKELTIPAQYTITKSLLPDQIFSELKNKIGPIISNNGKSVSTLSREEWRIVRGVEKGVSERVSVAKVPEKIKTFLLTFHPRHCPGGGDYDNDPAYREPDNDPPYREPDKWSEYLFTPKMKEIFENLYYNINSYDDWYESSSILRPSIRALIQDDRPKDHPERKPVELCLSSLFEKWKKQHKNITIDYIRSNYICNNKSYPAMGDYLWFNAVRLCRTLSTLINNRKNINAINIYQIGTPELDCVDNSGITCCIYMDDDADGDNNLYNKLFPSSKDHNGDINIDRECSMCKFCYELFLAGCDWIFYSRKDNDNKLLFHILYPTAALFDIPYKIPSKCTDIIKSGSQSFDLQKNSIDKIPTLTFHIAPDIVKTSFRKRLYDAFVVRSSEYFVNLNNDQQRKLYENIIAVISKVTNGVFDEE